MFGTFFGGTGDCTVDRGSCTDNVLLFSSSISRNITLYSL